MATRSPSATPGSGSLRPDTSSAARRSSSSMTAPGSWFSGDYKRRADATCAPFEPQAADLFVTEATFALPVFRHPPDGMEIAKLLRFARPVPRPRPPGRGLQSRQVPAHRPLLAAPSGLRQADLPSRGARSDVRPLPAARHRAGTPGSSARAGRRRGRRRDRAVPSRGAARPLVAPLRRPPPRAGLGAGWACASAHGSAASSCR